MLRRTLVHIFIVGTFLLFGVTLFSLLGHPITLEAADASGLSCAGGVAGHLASEAEAKAATDNSITAGVTYLCPNDARIGISNESGAAKEYLSSHACAQTIHTGIAAACPAGTRSLHIDGLASQFAVYAANYMKKFEAQNGQNTICVRDAYRAPGEQACAANNSANGGAVAQPGKSKHEVGEAVDLNPQNGATYTKMRSFADQNESCVWFRYYCPQDNSSGNAGKSNIGTNGDCPHLELKSSCNAGTPGASTGASGRYTSTPAQSFSTPQSDISSSPGVGSMTPGQTYGQDTTCLLSTDPIYTVSIPAGTPFPSNCLNNGHSSSATGIQASCSGNTIIYNASGNATIGQTCPYGCQNGMCMQSQQNQQQGQQQGQQYAAANPTPSASSPTTNGQTAVSSGVQSALQTNTTPTLSTPSLIPNLLTPSSTLSILNALANPQQVVTIHATPTPIILNPDAQKISQLQAGAPPGVTYALPASSYFSNGNQTGQTTSAGANTITTTAGTGYDTATSTDTRVLAIAGTRTPTGADTFTSSNLSSQGTQGSPSQQVSTFPGNTTSILETLKLDLQGVLNFLATYGRPFGGVVPSQVGGE
jgi:hypothetical protein